MELKNIVPGSNPDLHKPSWFSGHKILGYIFLFVILAAIVIGVYYYQVSTGGKDYVNIVRRHK